MLLIWYYVDKMQLDLQSIGSSPDLHILCARDTIMILFSIWVFILCLLLKTKGLTSELGMHHCLLEVLPSPNPLFIYFIFLVGWGGVTHVIIVEIFSDCHATPEKVNFFFAIFEQEPLWTI